MAFSSDNYLLQICDQSHQQVFRWSLINARSLKNKISDFAHFCHSSDFDFVCITETWLDENCPDKVFMPVGYNVFRKDRVSKTGGGVAFVVKERFTVSRT